MGLTNVFSVKADMTFPQDTLRKRSIAIAPTMGIHAYTLMFLPQKVMLEKNKILAINTKMVAAKMITDAIIYCLSVKRLYGKAD